MSDKFEEMLRQTLGFKPVDRAEVERVEASVKQQVVQPVTERLPKQQEKVEQARTWYVAGSVLR